MGSPKQAPDSEHSVSIPPAHQNVEIKEEIIPLHPSFDKNQTNSLKITGITGTWDVNYRVGISHIHLKYVSPDKREGRQREFIEKSHKLTYKQFREKVEAAIWELEKGLCGDRNFRVKVWARDINELEPKWVENCKLISTPNPPSSTMFIFASPSGRAIPKAGLEEFELMEE